MLVLNRKRQLQLIVLALLGLGYFSGFSTQVEVNFFLKGLAFVLPLQIATLFYFLYRSLKNR